MKFVGRTTVAVVEFPDKRILDSKPTNSARLVDLACLVLGKVLSPFFHKS
jgi:hypothetical protein